MKMVILTGKNLGERHRELNQKVATAAAENTSFDEIEHEEGRSDIDKIFNIGIASRFKNLEYIIEVLKSGNSLFVTRALKCVWLYNDRYSDIINPTYLEQNIFPHMSQRIKKKMLTVISLHVRNADRVTSFYTYCVKSKLKELAVKFLIYSPESFKMNLIKQDDNFYYFDDNKYLIDFIGYSLPLAVAYVEMHCDEGRIYVMHSLRFLYFKYTKEYLDMLEKYNCNDPEHPDQPQRLGIKISRDILKKHKHRIWKFAAFYMNKLNKSMLVKYLTIEDVKSLAPLLLPNTSSDFWSIDFYNTYKFILDVIPSTEIFEYLKGIFTPKYNNELFEMDYNFYNLRYYEMLSDEEQETWALAHVESDKELHGSGNDYIWYKFVRFEKALVAIKQYVYITVDNDTRSNIVNILVYSAKCQNDLTKLLNYYYDRHVNESFEHKTSFIDTVLSIHDVYAFTDECWASLSKLLHSLETYSAPDTYSINWHLRKYKMMSSIYYIVNNKELPENLLAFFRGDRCFHDYYVHLDGLSKQRCDTFIKYWLDMRAENLRVLLEKPRDDKITEDIHDQICLIWGTIWCYKRDQKECPDIVMNFMKSDLDFYGDHPAIRPPFQAMAESDFVRLLKNDTQIATDSIAKVKCNAHRWSFKLNRFFRKIKLYFPNDISMAYLEYFTDSLESLRNDPAYYRNYRNIKMAVVAVFQLGSKASQLSMLEKYAPVNKKIDHESIDSHLFQVQKAICRLIYYSSQSIPLSTIRKYATGDYLQYCLPLFNNYLVNLPLLRVIEFIHEVIDSPVSVQKHGLRLAFKCFGVHDLTPIILNVWKKTENVSLRLVLYKTLFLRMMKEDDLQKDLYEVLKVYTSDLNDRDNKNIFDLLVSEDMPEDFRGDYIQTAWGTVSKFSDKNINVARKSRLICHMRENITLLKPEFLQEHIIDEHVRKLLSKNSLKPNCALPKIEELMKAKWDLTAAYIINGNINIEIRNKKCKIAKKILNKCMHMWNYQYKNVYTFRELCRQFLNTIHVESGKCKGRYSNARPIYQCLLGVLQKSFPNDELYLLTWNWKLSIESRRAIYNHHVNHKKCPEYAYPCVFDIADDFAKTVGNFVMTLENDGEFYYSFYPEMAKALIKICCTMGEVMEFNPIGFRILFSGHLTQIKMYETHMLAVLVVPESPPDYWEKRHQNVIQMIKQYDDDEIKGYLYYKFPYLGSDVNTIAQL